MVKEKNNDYVIKVSFEETPLPEFTEKKINSKDWVYYGVDNIYPDYLLGLFENSSYHNAIVSGKADYIKGKGFVVDNDGLNTTQVATIQKFINFPNPNESLDDILEKIALDLEIYGGFAVEILWGKASKKISEIHYIDIHNLRLSKEGKSVFYSNDWSQSSQNESKTGLIEIPLFDERVRKGKCIYYYCEPRKNARVYPKPGYIGGIKAVKTDVEITNFHYNSLLNGFTGGTLVNFANGTPNKEEQKEISKKLKAKHTGTDNAGTVVLSFSDGKDKAPSVLALNGNDLDKRFDQLDKATQQKIFTCHKVTSPMLFGIKTEGQLGGRSEIIEAFELFQNGYICSKQKRIIDIFNYFLFINKIEPRISIGTTKPIGIGVTAEAAMEEMTTDEIRKFAGLEKLDLENGDVEKAVVIGSVGGVQGVIEVLKAVSQKLMTTESATALLVNVFGFSKKTAIAIIGNPQPAIEAQPDAAVAMAAIKKEIDIFIEFGRDKDKYEVLRSKGVNFKSSKDAVLSEIKLLRTKFAVQVDTFQREILDLIKQDPQITSEEIHRTTERSVAEVERAIEILKEEKIISGTLGKNLKVEEEISEPENAIEVVYSYEERTDVPDAKESRDFCVELMSVNKFFTRDDIEKISALVNRDVWATRGGFYHNPDTDIDTPYCRHIWKQHIVKRK